LPSGPQASEKKKDSIKLNTEIIASKIKKPTNFYFIPTHKHKLKRECKGFDEVLDKMMDTII